MEAASPAPLATEENARRVDAASPAPRVKVENATTAFTAVNPKQCVDAASPAPRTKETKEENADSSASLPADKVWNFESDLFWPSPKRSRNRSSSNSSRSYKRYKAPIVIDLDDL